MTLSVVVTIVEGGAALVRCLEALARQSSAPPMEVIVPFDDATRDAMALADRFPEVRFIDMGPGVHAGPRNAFHEHGRYERRRAAGLGAATGRLVALLEDRGWPRTGWAAAMTALHNRLDAGAIGGGVEHGGRGALRWALFFCDFGRYQPGIAEGDAEYLSDVNLCYKREALEATRDLWAEIYQESTVNWAMRRRGFGLHLSREAVVVESRAEARLGPVLLERLHWARIFAHVRGREAPSTRACLLWAAATPALPLLLFQRHLRRQLRLGRHRLAFMIAAPATLALLHAWALGEAIGYGEAALARLRGRGRPTIGARR